MSPLSENVSSGDDGHPHSQGPSENLEYRRIDYSGLGQQRFGRAYHVMVAASVLVFWSFVSIIPVYNKFFFQKSKYPYPVATAGIQLGFVSLLLAVLNIFQHFASTNRRDRTSDGHRSKENIENLPRTSTKIDDSRSWILSSHFWWKIKWCFPIGALFGMKYGITNLGLHLVPAPTHLLLQSTDLVWTVLGAYIINAEVVSKVELFCLGGCIAGSIFLGWSIESSALSAPWFAILVNLTSPILLGLCLTTLRLACTELMRPDNRVGGTVTSVELTSIKLMISSLVALILACLMEGGDDTKASWWLAFMNLERATQLGVIGGSILIAVFQVNCTFLTFLTSAVSVGLVGQVKIIPQWILATITAKRTTGFKIREMNMIGALLIIVSAGAFALYNYLKVPVASEPESSYHEADCENSEDHHHSHPKYQTKEERPLLLLRDADDWGAPFLRKCYDSIRGETTEEIVGYGGSSSLVVEEHIPILTRKNSTRIGNGDPSTNKN